MAKFYAVKSEENLIFKNWDDCKFYLEGKKGYKYKSFSTQEEAQAYLDDRDYYGEVLEKDRESGFAVAFTDGSFEESTGRYSYGAITVSPDGNERSFCGYGANPEFISTRNIAGEVEGVLSAVKWAFFNGYEKLKIYHDYEGLAAWAEGRWKINSSVAVYYIERLNRYKGVIDITFKKVKGHSNNKYNEHVDQLAKDALFNGRTESISGRGCKVSGTYYFDDMVKWLNRQVPKAKVEQNRGGVVFTVNGENLALYPGYTACGIVSNGDFLYCLSLCYFLKNHKDLAVNRLIERFFECDTNDGARYGNFETALTVIEYCKENKAPCIIFALFELENAIREKIGVEDKISPYFIKNGESFCYKGETDEEELICDAYNYFYSYRKDWLTLQLSEKQAKEVVLKAKSLTERLTRRKNGS